MNDKKSEDARWDLTQFEALALDSTMNLSDAHNRLPVSPQIGRSLRAGLLTRLWAEASTAVYSQLVRNCVQEFSQLTSPLMGSVPDVDVLPCYASSVAMSILAMSLRHEQMSVALIEPTFDNIPDLLRQSGVELHAVAEHSIFDGDLAGFVGDCLFVTVPNNPTGRSGDAGFFQRLFEWAESTNVVLILDRSFAAFDPLGGVDVYSIAQDFADLSLIVIEDSGKIFPSLDQKLGFLIMATPMRRNAELKESLRRHHSSILLNVSPFTLRIVEEFCRDGKDGGLSYVQSKVLMNRQRLRREITSDIFVPPEYYSSWASVELLDVRSVGSARATAAMLEQGGIYVLPADKFYWSRPTHDSGLIRVALARPTDVFKSAVDRMFYILNRGRGA